MALASVSLGTDEAGYQHLRYTPIDVGAGYRLARQLRFVTVKATR